MNSPKYQNIPLEQIGTNVVQDINHGQSPISNNSNSSYSNNGYEEVGQDDDNSDTFVYIDSNSLSLNENKITEVIDDEIVIYDNDDQARLINNGEVDINLKDNILNAEKSSIFGSTFNFTNSIIGAGIYNILYYLYPFNLIVIMIY